MARTRHRSGRRATITFVLVGLAGLAGIYLLVCWFILTTLITPQRKHAELTPAELGFEDAQPLSFASAEDQIDLRAHGESGGEHTGLGALERRDVRAAVTLLRQRGFRTGQIGIHGSSYGAAIALLAARQIPEIGAVVSDSAFADIRDVVGGELQREIGLPARLARLLMPGMDWLARLLYSVRLDRGAPEDAIRGIAPRPILLIHGEEDSVIPFDHARRIKAAAGEAAELWSIPGEHTQGVRMAPRCEEPAPTRGAFLARVVKFFERNLAVGVASR